MAFDQAFIEQLVHSVVSALKEIPAQPEVLVLGADSDELRDRLQQSLGGGQKLVYWDPRTARTKEALGKNYAQIIVAQLSCTEMADLAAGRASSRLSAVILDLLLQGKPVQVFEYVYRRYQQSAPPALWELYCGYEKQLATFGLRQYEEVAATAQMVRQRLLTEKDMLGYASAGLRQLQVPADTVITALAADTARAHGIEIVKEMRASR